MERINIEEYRLAIKKKNKYGNKKTTYKGEKYDSKKEADFARTIDSCYRAIRLSDRVMEVRRQVPFPCDVKKKRICVYLADFVVKYADGHKEVIDVKGFRTKEYKLKKKLVEAIYKIKIKEI